MQGEGVSFGTRYLAGKRARGSTQPIIMRQYFHKIRDFTADMLKRIFSFLKTFIIKASLFVVCQHSTIQQGGTRTLISCVPRGRGLLRYPGFELRSKGDAY